MSELEMIIRDLTEEKDKMIEELAILNGRREQLRDDICRFNRAISGIKMILRKEEAERGESSE